MMPTCHSGDSPTLRVILREPERSDRRPKDRSRAKAVELPRGKAILRRFAPQDGSAPA